MAHHGTHSIRADTIYQRLRFNPMPDLFTFYNYLHHQRHEFTLYEQWHYQPDTQNWIQTDWYKPQANTTMLDFIKNNSK